MMLPMPRPVPVFEGSLVTLRPIDVDRDARDYYDMNLDPEMHRWTGNHVFATVDEARGHLRGPKPAAEAQACGKTARGRQSCMGAAGANYLSVSWKNGPTPAPCAAGGAARGGGPRGGAEAASPFSNGIPIPGKAGRASNR